METRYSVTGCEEVFTTEKQAIKQAKRVAQFLEKVYVVEHFKNDKGEKRHFDVGYYKKGKFYRIEISKIYPEFWDGIWEGK